MKCLVSMIVIAVSLSAGAQTKGKSTQKYLINDYGTRHVPISDYSITLAKNQYFKKIPFQQMMDSINGLQKDYQYQCIDITATNFTESDVDRFMKDCNSIKSIINRFGKTRGEVYIGPPTDPSHKIYSPFPGSIIPFQKEACSAWKIQYSL